MPGRILIVEDNVINCELMAYLLQASGYQTVHADTGLLGIELAKREEFDLILCDIRLPGLDGFEIAKRFRQDALIRAIPLVAVSASAMLEDRNRALAAGFAGYISEPIAPETFVGDVETFMNSDRPENTVRSLMQQRQFEPASEDSHVAAIFKGTILVVDNMESNLDLARSILEPSGFRVLAAQNVESALGITEREKPDLILSDVNMPEGTGFELARRIRRDPHGTVNSIPLVLISSTLSPDEQGPQCAAAAGATKFLSRPIDPQLLLEELKSCLQK